MEKNPNCSVKIKIESVNGTDIICGRKNFLLTREW